jgi:cytoskeletal protein RodZ
LSSILKALQRLESETREKDAGQSWLQNFSTGQRHPEKREWIRSKSLMALLCIAILITGTLTFIFIKKQPPSITSVSGSQPVQGAGNPGINNESTRLDPFADKSIGAREAGKSEVESGRPPETGIIDEDDRSIRKTVPAGVNKGDARESSPAGMPVVTRDAKKGGNVYPEKLSEQDTRLVPEENLLDKEIEAADEPSDSIVAKRIHNPEMKLHAISWTPDIKTRIAVINGSIVREGNTTGSYLVYKINKDDIVLRKNGELWRLVFGGK